MTLQSLYAFLFGPRKEIVLLEQQRAGLNHDVEFAQLEDAILKQYIHRTEDIDFVPNPLGWQDQLIRNRRLEAR